jgi:pimeloyl-ACP methyl ester carboxylesterase
MIEHHIKLNNCIIHAIDSGSRGQGLPFVYIPGIAGVAEDGAFFLEAFPERRCISISMRGRGLSSTPLGDYAISDHANDIADVLEALGVESSRFHLHGYSIAVMYCLSFLQLKRLQPATLILGDHPAEVEKLPENWAESFGASQINGNPILDKIRLHALKGIEKASRAESLVDALIASQWPLPVLLLHGGNCGPVPSRITQGHIEQYQRSFKRLQLFHFKNSGHFFRDTERDLYLEVVREFINSYDN